MKRVDGEYGDSSRVRFDHLFEQRSMFSTFDPKPQINILTSNVKYNNFIIFLINYVYTVLIQSQTSCMHVSAFSVPRL